jgi:tRNA-intron endonuclease
MAVDRKALGYFYGTRVVIWNIEDARRIWSLGYFGKPMGIPKPKAPDFESPLLLDLLEAFYLHEKGYIEILDEKASSISQGDLLRLCRRSYADFDEKYLVYRDLRDRGLVVLSGLKFGVDFAVYRKGPGLEHAPYLIDVVSQNYLISGDDLIRAGRLATTVRKRFILAVPNLVDKKVRYIMFSWWRP